MKRAAADSEDRIRLAPGTLYVNLKKLLDSGVIEETVERPDPALDDSRRRYYRLTAEGRTILSSELGRMDHLVQLGAKYGAAGYSAGSGS
jgi:DNA-binding PadR family transcriptional regulator